MSPFILWLFFTLDRVISVFNILLGWSITYIILAILIWLIGGAMFTDGTDDKSATFWKWTSGFNKHMKKWNILAIVLFSVSLFFSTLLPNTKEAVAIVIIPKAIAYAQNNKELMKIPDNILKMANSFMEKKIGDWAKGLVPDSTKAPDSLVSKATTAIATAKEVVSDVKKTAETFKALKDTILKK